MKSLITLILAALLLVSCNTFPASAPAETTAGADTITEAITAGEPAITDNTDDTNAPTTALPDDRIWKYDKIQKYKYGEYDTYECKIHEKPYHSAFDVFDKYISLYLLEDEYKAWEEGKVSECKDVNADCSVPTLNIYEFIKDFDVPRESFEWYLNMFSPQYLLTCDLDLLYGSDAKAVEESFIVTYDEHWELRSAEVKYSHERDIVRALIVGEDEIGMKVFPNQEYRDEKTKRITENGIEINIYSIDGPYSKEG